eukprot:9340606-Pyramimonas_sp.AAC.1
MGLPRPGGVALVLDREGDLVPVRKWVNLVLRRASLVRPAWALLARKQVRISLGATQTMQKQCQSIAQGLAKNNIDFLDNITLECTRMCHPTVFPDVLPGFDAPPLTPYYCVCSRSL